MKATAKEIAKYFIWKSNNEGKIITNKKLQKLVYYAQAWAITLKNKPLFDEDIQAWVHGPTVYSVYNAYRSYGYNAIIEKVEDREIENIPEKKLLDDIWEIYGKNYDADYLEQLTHNEPPWQKARESLSPMDRSESVISHNDMKAYYSTLLNSK